MQQLVRQSYVGPMRQLHEKFSNLSSLSFHPRQDKRGDLECLHTIAWSHRPGRRGLCNLRVVGTEKSRAFASCPYKAELAPFPSFPSRVQCN
jgi:hypothetical protein